MNLYVALRELDRLAESGSDSEREAWAFIRDFFTLPRTKPHRLDRVAWGDGNAEQDE